MIGTLSVNGATLAYEMEGKGHPLILLHAGIADSRMWDEQFPVLAEQFQVVRYDARGYGKSEPVAGAFYPYEDLVGVMDALEIEKAYLLGCSMGGKTMLDFALAYPDRVSALIPVASALGGFVFNAWSKEQAAAIESAEQKGDFARISEIEMQIWFDGLHRTAKQVNQAARQKAYEMNLKALQNEALVESIEQRLDPPALNRLTEIHAPTCVIVGELDVPAILEIADKLTNEIDGAYQIVMPNVAHLPNMENPADFNQHVIEFLKSLEEKHETT